jgi:hypothetical protein
MKLGEFIEKYIEPNCLVRLVYKNKGGHKLVLDTWNDVTMEWEILKGKGKNRHFIDNEVLGITSILTSGHYKEAINIVIEELDNRPYIDETVEKLVTNI